MTSSASNAASGEYLWTNARLLAAEVSISASGAGPLLPAALALADPPTATLFVADYPETRFGSVYREAAVLLHAADSQGPAIHCPWMVVDEDTALILGRELLGFPKRLAEITLEEGDGRVIGVVRRRGTEIMRIEAQLGEVEPEPAPLFGRRVVNVIGTPVTGLKLVELPAAEEVIHSSRAADAKVTLGSSERDALGELQAAPSARARYLTLDFGSTQGLGSTPRLLGDVDADWVARRLFARAM